MKKMTLILSVAAALVGLGTSCQKEKQAPGDFRALNAGGSLPCSDSTGTDTLRGVISGTKTLSNSIVYYIDGITYVTGTLNIPAGTLIRGLAGTPKVGSNPGTPGGTLVITKSGYIDAQGTASCPIVFTSYRSYQGAESGDWGGVVILGEATHNRANSTVVEGITGTPPADATYGGSNDADNSGILKYVRIEYAGWELSTDNELNGLTLAGVGSGTTISYVEVYKSKDDGIEFFGGTVNGDHLIVVDPQDDMFDFDNGYRGTINYALGLSDFTRADKSQSNGIECDGISTGDSLAFPRTFPKLKHFTIIGQPNATAASTVYTSLANGTYGRLAHFRRNTQFYADSSIFIGFNNGISLDASGTPSGYTKIWYEAGRSTLDNNLVHAFVRPFATEASGVFTSYAFPLTLNSAYSGANPNTGINLSSPFSRTSFANFVAVSGGDADFYKAGAAPVGATWGSSIWARY